jgi:uncharacterized membrane protein (DUF373 family)
MEKLLDRFKQVILGFVLVVLVIVLALGAVELAVAGVRQILTPPIFLLDVTKLTEIFSIVLMLVIGLELIESVEVAFFGKEGIGKIVEYIILIAVIAIGRKIIILDVSYLEPLTLFGIAAILLALSVGYYFLKKTRPEEGDKP